ncbi:MAG TPA: response regulator [Bacillota bacterium]|nr:response regulator [Bacillota bacterium]
MRLLVADDAMFMRMLLKRYLASFNFTEILEAGDGQQAVELYRECRPDLVTLDLTMPEMDGLAALKQIMEYDRDAKVIVCSALGTHKYITEALVLGARNFIVKPFLPEQIIKTVQYTLEARAHIGAASKAN